MCKGKNYSENAVANFSVATQYFNVVENQFQQTLNQGNAHLLVFDHVNWEEEYDRKTSASDFNIIIPTLYCLYHGIELALKSILLLNEIDPPTMNEGHKLGWLYKMVNDISVVPEEIKKLFESFLEPKDQAKDFVGFLKNNNKTIDNISEVLRYPSDKDFNQINSYIGLKYKEEKLIPYIEDILKNCKELRIKIVAYFRSKKL